jgi:uncharacterized membrane protein
MLRYKAKNPKVLLLIGMTALLLANILNVVLRWAGDAENLVMGAMGLFYGISFALLLMSVRLKARRRAGLEDPCA